MQPLEAEALFELAQVALSSLAERLEKGEDATPAIVRALAEMQRDYLALLDRFSLPRSQYAVDRENLGQHVSAALNDLFRALKQGKDESAARKAFWERFNAAISPRLF